MVLALVFLEIVRGHRLVPETHLVNEGDSALPVSEENLPRRRAVAVVLASGEIPHKISPVHPVELVVEKESHIFHKGRLSVAVSPFGILAHIGCVEFPITVISAGTAVPHPREEHLVRTVVDYVAERRHFFVFSVHGCPIPVIFNRIVCIEILSVDYRSASILLTAEVAAEGERIVGLVLICRGVHAGTYDHDCKNGEAHDDGSETEQYGVCHSLTFLHRMEKTPEAEPEEQQQEEHRPRIVRQVEDIHEEQVEIGCKFRYIWDDEEKYHCKYDTGQGEDAEILEEGVALAFALAIEPYEHKARYGEEVEQVHPDGQAHKEGNQDYPPVGVWLVGLVVPFCHSPKDQGCEEGGHSVHFAFHG